MIERALRNYLEGKLTHRITFEAQKNPPEKYYILERTGGSKRNHVYSSMFAIQSYAGKLSEAMEMSHEAVEAMLGAVELDAVCSIELNSEYNFTDTAKKKYRYQAVFDVVHY